MDQAPGGFTQLLLLTPWGSSVLVISENLIFAFLPPENGCAFITFPPALITTLVILTRGLSIESFSQLA